jgi:hypothetical protein
LVASLLLLNPMSKVTSPGKPPRAVKKGDHVTSLINPTGPKITRDEKELQANTPIKSQAPMRAHHSRSESAVRRLPSPMNNDAVRRKTRTKTGAAKQT